MIKTIDVYDFRQAFKNMGRETQFSNDALSALFDYLEQLENDIDEKIELDVIALCCDYSESSIKDALENYGLESLDDLRNNTTVIEVDDDTIIYQNY